MILEVFDYGVGDRFIPISRQRLGSVAVGDSFRNSQLPWKNSAGLRI